MASKRVTRLKWRKVKGDLFAGPFMLVADSCSKVNWHYIYVRNAITEGWSLIGGEELDAAKRACEKLASRILGAMK